VILSEILYGEKSMKRKLTRAYRKDLIYAGIRSKVGDGRLGILRKRLEFRRKWGG
jgi:hypothetical protein